eukprot:1300179-Pleurochrysis_carterae.AAC.1
MPMTSTGTERLFALGRAHDVRARASRDDTRARASSLATPTVPRPGSASAPTARRSGSCCTRGRGRASR